ncbi:MAG: hypothetical protein R3C26_11410 [Calditrichia bacterium]
MKTAAGKSVLGWRWDLHLPKFKILVTETIWSAVGGGVVGCALGVGYAALMIYGLKTIWANATGTTIVPACYFAQFYCWLLRRNFGRCNCYLAVVAENQPSVTGNPCEQRHF